MNKRLVALATASVLILCGCGEGLTEQLTKETAQVELEKTISDNSKWINSSIPGAINADTQVRAQDDFYTYVNKDTILAIDLDDDFGTFQDRGDEIVKQRKIMIVSGEEDPEANAEVGIDIPAEYVEHDEELVRQFADAVRDWDSRNSLGREPLHDYIAAIEGISDLSEMTDYILDKNGDNFTNDSLISLEVHTLVSNPKEYSVVLGRTTDYLLNSRDKYISIDSGSIKLDRIIEEEVIYALTGIGYSEKEAKRVLKNCYNFEGKLADASMPDFLAERTDTMIENENAYSLEEIRDMQGKYPLCDLMNLYGYDNTDTFYVPYEYFVKKVGRLYSESNLELIKAYYIVHTIHEAMPLLDKESYELSVKYEKNVITETDITLSNPDGDVREQQIKDEWDRILQKYITKYLAEPLEISYLARYCTKEEKEYLTKLTDDLTAYFEEMINTEDWMGEESRTGAIDKLSHIKKHILYPETFRDYSDIQFEDSDNLLDMVRKTKKSRLRHVAENAGKPVNPDDWDLYESQSSTVNAFYYPKENAIYIMAGILVADSVYDEDMPYEHNLAGIGTIIGHEITHGFDKNGSRFDKEGRSTGWWNAEEFQRFSDRTRNLEKYYDSLPPAPGMANMSGTKVENEAIADMGGMKACLSIAESVDDFDYDLFFRSYAQLWCQKTPYSSVLFSALEDEHPLGFLRTNVTLSQFDKFLETYDVKEGDGMYCPVEDRIAVW